MKRLIPFIFLLVLMYACNYKEAGQAHSHEGVKLELSSFNKDLEVLLVADPFSMNKTSTIRAYITSLKDYKPIEMGSATISMEIGRDGIRQTLDEPSQKGICDFKLQPETAGKARIILDIKTEQGDSRVVFTGVQVFANDHAAVHEAESKSVKNPNEISFSKEKSWKVDFETGYPVMETFGEVIRTTAHVFSAPGDEMILSARTSGLVQFTDKSLMEGLEIDSDQVLFTISGDELASENAALRFAEAKSNYTLAEANYERIKKLASDKIISEKELLQAKNEFDIARAVYENLKQNFNSEGQFVSSPVDAYIKDLFVSNGEFVEEGEPLLIIAQNKCLVLKADVQQKYASVLPDITSARIKCMNNNKVFTLEQLNGRMLSSGKATNPENYLLPVSFLVDYNEDLIPGSFVEMYIKTEGDSKVLTIPNTALLEEQGSYFVFIQLMPHKFIMQEVDPGATDGIRTEIKSELSVNDRIVTKGAIWVKLAQSSDVLDPHAGHVH